MTAELAAPAAIAVHRWPCTGRRRSSLPLVLWHGWGADSQVWEPLCRALQPHFDLLALDLPGFGESPSISYQLDDLLDNLARAMPKRAHLLGWSLGGMLAVAYAARYPERVAALVTIAANPSFIARKDWPDAMAPAVYRNFCRSFRQEPRQTQQQFAGLQAKGDGRERQLLRRLRRLADQAPSDGAWNEALALLGEMDNRERLAALTVPSLHLFGENDNLVPAQAAPRVDALSAHVRVTLLEGVAHVPHLSAPETVAEHVLAFLSADDKDDGYRIDKQRVARSFSRAAGTYDSAAALQREVGESLLALAGDDKRDAGRVVDIGCGTGHFTDRLAQELPHAQCLGLDLAEGMVRYGREHHRRPAGWVCADAEQLPLADNSIDLAFSNFTVQWCQDLPGLASEIFRVLRPGGRLILSSVGPASLWELRDAWQQVDRYVHVNRFTAAEVLARAMTDSGFQLSRCDARRQVKYHPDLRDLTRELKGLGAHNVNAGRNTALTGRQRLSALKAGYEVHRTEQGLPATWEVIRLVAEKP